MKGSFAPKWVVTHRLETASLEGCRDSRNRQWEGNLHRDEGREGEGNRRYMESMKPFQDKHCGQQAWRDREAKQEQC